MSLSPEPVEISSTSATHIIRGAKAGMSVPAFMVFVGMIGFGSLAKSQGVSLFATLLTGAGIYGLPGQVAMLELYATGASLLVITIAVAMANMRFLPMSVVLMPLFDPADKLYPWRFLSVQVMSINSWTHMLQVASDMPRSARLGFFTGFGLSCFTLGMCGAVTGWLLAGTLSVEMTVALIFLNPAYFIFLFCCNRNINVLCSLALGALLGPPLYQFSPDWGLPLCGLIAGTSGYLLCRKK